MFINNNTSLKTKNHLTLSHNIKMPWITTHTFIFKVSWEFRERVNILSPGDCRNRYYYINIYANIIIIGLR